MDREVDGVSIIICCYNSGLRLPETLAHLAAQNFEVAINWELILVNNNSEDKTVEIARSLWTDFGSPTFLNIVDEPTAGLTYAREKGMSVAQYNLFLFCDDDNWLHENYIQNAISIFKQNPQIGALGGWSKAVFEGEKPEWFDRFAGNFAVGKPVKTSGIIDSPQGFLYGAGLLIPKRTISHLGQTGFKSILSDRKGKLLSSGGDIELIYAIKLIGRPVMFSDSLFFYHFMPRERMRWTYLLKLRQSMYWSNFVLNIYIDAITKQPNSLLWLTKKLTKSGRYIYKNKKRLPDLENRTRLLLENQIAIRLLFIKNIPFYYKTRLKLKQLKNA